MNFREFINEKKLDESVTAAGVYEIEANSDNLTVRLSNAGKNSGVSTFSGGRNLVKVKDVSQSALMDSIEESKRKEFFNNAGDIALKYGKTLEKNIKSFNKSNENLLVEYTNELAALAKKLK